MQEQTHLKNMKIVQNQKIKQNQLLSDVSIISQQNQKYLFSRAAHIFWQIFYSKKNIPKSNQIFITFLKNFLFSCIKKQINLKQALQILSNKQKRKQFINKKTNFNSLNNYTKSIEKRRYNKQINQGQNNQNEQNYPNNIYLENFNIKRSIEEKHKQNFQNIIRHKRKSVNRKLSTNSNRHTIDTSIFNSNNNFIPPSFIHKSKGKKSKLFHLENKRKSLSSNYHQSSQFSRKSPSRNQKQTDKNQNQQIILLKTNSKFKNKFKSISPTINFNFQETFSFIKNPNNSQKNSKTLQIERRPSSINVQESILSNKNKANLFVYPVNSFISYTISQNSRIQDKIQEKFIKKQFEKIQNKTVKNKTVKNRRYYHVEQSNKFYKNLDIQSNNIEYLLKKYKDQFDNKSHKSKQKQLLSKSCEKALQFFYKQIVKNQKNNEINLNQSNFQQQSKLKSLLSGIRQSKTQFIRQNSISPKNQMNKNILLNSDRKKNWKKFNNTQFSPPKSFKISNHENINTKQDITKKRSIIDDREFRIKFNSQYQSISIKNQEINIYKNEQKRMEISNKKQIIDSNLIQNVRASVLNQNKLIYKKNQPYSQFIQLPKFSSEQRKQNKKQIQISNNFHQNQFNKKENEENLNKKQVQKINKNFKITNLYVVDNFEQIKKTKNKDQILEKFKQNKEKQSNELQINTGYSNKAYQVEKIQMKINKKQVQTNQDIKQKIVQKEHHKNFNLIDQIIKKPQYKDSNQIVRNQRFLQKQQKQIHDDITEKLKQLEGPILKQKEILQIDPKEIQIFKQQPISINKFQKGIQIKNIKSEKQINAFQKAKIKQQQNKNDQIRDEDIDQLQQIKFSPKVKINKPQTLNNKPNNNIVSLKSIQQKKQKKKIAQKANKNKNQIKFNNKPPLPNNGIRNQTVKQQNQSQSKKERKNSQRLNTNQSSVASSYGPLKSVKKMVEQYMFMINKIGQTVAKSSKISIKLQGVTQWYVGIYFLYKRFLFQRKRIQRWFLNKTPKVSRYDIPFNQQEWMSYLNSSEFQSLFAKLRQQNINIAKSIQKMQKKLLNKKIPQQIKILSQISRRSVQQSKIAVQAVINQFDDLIDNNMLKDEQILIHCTQLLNSCQIIAQLDQLIEQREPLQKFLQPKRSPEQLQAIAQKLFNLYQYDDEQQG